MLSWSLHEQLCTHPVIHYVNIVETFSVGYVHKLVLCVGVGVGVGGNLNERDQGRVLTLFNRCEWTFTNYHGDLKSGLLQDLPQRKDFIHL